jgi:hypothetical protein
MSVLDASPLGVGVEQRRHWARIAAIERLGRGAELVDHVIEYATRARSSSLTLSRALEGVVCLSYSSNPGVLERQLGDRVRARSSVQADA